MTPPTKRRGKAVEAKVAMTVAAVAASLGGWAMFSMTDTTAAPAEAQALSNPPAAVLAPTTAPATGSTTRQQTIPATGQQTVPTAQVQTPASELPATGQQTAPTAQVLPQTPSTQSTRPMARTRSSR